jgi:hypothetical protein
MPGGLRQRRMDSYLRIEIIGFGLIERQVYVYRESNGQKQPLFLIELAIDWHMNLAPQNHTSDRRRIGGRGVPVQKHTSTILKGC